MTVTYPGGGASVAVAPDTTALLQGDGVDLFGVAGGGSGGGASALNDLTDVNAVLPSMATSCVSMAVSGHPMLAACTRGSRCPTRVL